MKHFSAIKCISNRIVELKAEIEVCEKISNNAEMEADCFFASEDIKNLKAEIERLKDSITILINKS